MSMIHRIAAAPVGHPIRRTVLIEARRRRDDSDMKLFVLSFTAFFVAIGAFIL